MAIKFEELKVWQEARSLTLQIYQLSSLSPFSKDFALKDQIRRASSSIMLNIAEGFDSGSNTQFIQFLYYALRSCSEVQSILYIATDNNYLSKTQFESLYGKAKTTRMLSFGLIKYLRKTVTKGDKKQKTCAQNQLTGNR